MNKNRSKNHFYILLALIILVLSASTVYAARLPRTDFCVAQIAPTGRLEVHVINVGQGDAVFIKSPDGKTILIDAGDNGMGDDVANYLKSLGVTTLDFVVASHYHADHIGGMDELMGLINVSQVLDRGGSYDSQTFQDYIAAAGPKRSIIGNMMDLGPNIGAEVFLKNSGSNENDKSIVLKLNFGKLNMIFGGDCESACEADLNPGDLEFYKVHHHGSKYSSTQSFLDKIRPEISVISVGTNSYGHPTKEALTRIKGVGSDICRTDQHGNVVMASDDGSTYKVEAKEYLSK